MEIDPQDTIDYINVEFTTSSPQIRINLPLNIGKFKYYSLNSIAVELNGNYSNRWQGSEYTGMKVVSTREGDAYDQLGRQTGVIAIIPYTVTANDKIVYRANSSSLDTITEIPSQESILEFVLTDMKDILLNQVTYIHLSIHVHYLKCI